MTPPSRNGSLLSRSSVGFHQTPYIRACRGIGVYSFIVSRRPHPNIHTACRTFIKPLHSSLFKHLLVITINLIKRHRIGASFISFPKLIKSHFFINEKSYANNGKRSCTAYSKPNLPLQTYDTYDF